MDFGGGLLVDSLLVDSEFDGVDRGFGAQVVHARLQALPPVGWQHAAVG